MTTLSRTPSQTSRPLPGLAFLDQSLVQFAPVTGRILLGGMFAYAGFGKIGAFTGTQAYMESFGVPGGLLPLVIAFEIGAGLMLMAGWQARFVATLLAGFTALTALVFHFDLGDPVQSLFFTKNLAIAGGLLMIAASGAGAISLDKARLSRTVQN